MLGFTLRRLLWTFPTLVAISIVTFFFLSFVPDPSEDPKFAATVGEARLVEIRRERFLDLPRFINPAPIDVQRRAEMAVQDVIAGGERGERGASELRRLGGAALPHVIPSLDKLPPGPRATVALALSPIAERMGLSRADEASQPGTAVTFWTRYWDDRGIEFRAATAKTAVERLARYRTKARATDLKELDTFALPAIIAALSAPTDAPSMERARALVEIAAHVTDRDDRIGQRATPEQATACIERWRTFWTIYESDYLTLSGASRVSAMVIETRYGKWALGAVTQRMGTTTSGQPVLDGLARRAPVTLTIVFGAIGIAYLFAIALGTLSAASRGRRIDLVVASVVLILYCIPVAVFAIALGPLDLGPESSLLGPTLLVSLGLLASPTRQHRATMVSVLSQDYMRTASAKGTSQLRRVFAHGLRNAVLPIVTLATLEAPMALGGAFVVENIFGLNGLGGITIDAVASRDVSWLMAISLFTATMATFGLIATDLAYVVLQPRLRSLVLSGRSRR